MEASRRVGGGADMAKVFILFACDEVCEIFCVAEWKKWQIGLELFGGLI